MKRVLVITAGIIFLVLACTKVPITGRTQLNLVGETEIRAMADHQYDSLMKAWPLITSGKNYQMLNIVGTNISKEVETYLSNNGYKKMAKGFAWEYNLVDNDTLANAWCMPGGKIAFYTGILPYTKDPNGMAVVMGHEIAHAVARHGNERMSQGLALQMGGLALSVALSTEPQRTQQLFLAAYGLGAQVGVMLPFSRKHELEADRIGLIFMAMAGYDPREAVEFWKRMAAKSEGGVPSELNFLSTHPTYDRRIDSIETVFLPEAMNYYKK